MKSSLFILGGVVFFALVYAAYYEFKMHEASLLLYNGVIYTLDDKQPVAEAVAINGDRIIGVGSSEDVRSKFSARKSVDLNGKPVYPGFTDAHAHFEGLGALLVNINLGGTASVEEIQRLVAERVAAVRPGEWVRGRSWDQNKWADKSFPSHRMLDGVAPENPVYLTRVDGHAVWVNQVALDLAGIHAATPDPAGGKILRDESGNPTGVLIDNAIDLMDSVMPAPTVAERTEAIQRALQECVKVGLTEIHDMGCDLEMIGIYKNLIKAKKFPFRVYAAIGGVGETWNYYLQHGPEVGRNEGRLTVRALKLYADGALGSRGAALIEPYSDDPTNRGLTLTSAELMKSASGDALRNGFQVCTHAIGDRANNIVLNVYEDVFKTDAAKATGARFRVEHAQVVEASDIPRFHALGVIPSMQPTHCTSDMYWAEERLGPKRVRNAYAWRSFLDAGSVIPGGSDFPVESPNPLLGFYAAITRQDAHGWPPAGWYPDQRMTREEALKAFTLWAAYAAFEEKSRGSIEKGKLADLVVLSNDIMKCDPQQILATTVVHTIVAGDIVYSVNGLAP